MTKDNAIKIQNITKIYEDRGSQLVALDNISFNVKKGSVVGILGHNGAGKSTLVRIITGLSDATFGSVFVDGLEASKRRTEIKSKIGCVTQDLCLDSFTTVYNTIKLYSMYYGKTNNEEKIEELLQTLDLAEKRNKQNFSLSIGMKRRLMMAKALVHNPEIIILDEPTVGVDFTVRAKILEYIQKLKREGKTIILITHHIDEVEKSCDDIVILEMGKVIYHDSKKNLLAMSHCEQLWLELSRLLSQSEKESIKAISAQTEFTENKLLLPNTEAKINPVLNFLLREGIKIIKINEEKPSLEKTIATITQRGADKGQK